MTEMESRLHAIIDSAPFGAHSYELRENGQLILIGANRSADKILGVNHSVFIGKPIEEAFPGLADSAIPARYRNVAATGVPFEADHVQYDHERVAGVFEIHAFQTGPLNMTVFFRDITEQRKIEAAFRESEQRYRDVVQHADAILFVIDNQGIFRMSEGRALAKIGLHPGQVVGMSALEIYKDNPTVMEALTAALGGRLARAMSVVNGIHFDAIYSPTYAHDGSQTGIIGLAIDVSERVRAEQEVRLLNRELEIRVKERTAQLEAAIAELEAFSYSVSHDLRAPLRGIDGWSEALLDHCGSSLDAEGRQCLERVRRDAKHMGQLIDDLLRLSRVSRMEVITREIDLSDLAQRVAAKLQESEPLRMVEWNIQAELAASGDPTLLEIALTNLMGNAWKFTGNKPNAVIEVGATETAEERVFFVRDNGAGFDMQYAQNLFGAFQRLHKQSEFPGSGIGLATVKRIIARHGGRIWADAAPGRGATFYFTLGTSTGNLNSALTRR